MKNIIGRIKCLFSKHEFVFKDSRLEYDHNKHVYYHRVVNECKYCERQSHEFLISRVSNRNIIGFFAYVLLAVVFTACNTECKEIDRSFRPHIVTHHHKSKVYRYYHNTPCSGCISVADDLRRDNRNVVEYLDNGEVVH
jgi:hypothetical protein